MLGVKSAAKHTSCTKKIHLYRHNKSIRVLLCSSAVEKYLWTLLCLINHWHNCPVHNALTTARLGVAGRAGLGVVTQCSGQQGRFAATTCENEPSDYGVLSFPSLFSPFLVHRIKFFALASKARTGPQHYPRAPAAGCNVTSPTLIHTS